MLFNSFSFLLVFLPLTLILHWLVERLLPDWRLPLLIVLSILFYGYWDWQFVPLLVLSIIFNWLIAELVVRSVLICFVMIAIVLKLFLLGLFKYAKFLAEVLPFFDAGTMFGANIGLPLGISFFTFHHIMYLIDLKARRAPRFDLPHYALYIAFFPQVLAGPLVRWNE